MVKPLRMFVKYVPQGSLLRYYKTGIIDSGRISVWITEDYICATSIVLQSANTYLRSVKLYCVCNI